MKHRELHTALANKFLMPSGYPTTEFTITIDFKLKVVKVTSTVMPEWRFSMDYPLFLSTEVIDLVKSVTLSYNTGLKT